MPRGVAADRLHRNMNISALCASSMQLLGSAKTEGCDLIFPQKLIRILMMWTYRTVYHQDSK